MVGAYRGSEVTDGHPLADALGALRSEAECTVVRLAGLDRDSVERLMRALTGSPVAADLVAAVCAETHGNPFFTREIVRHLREDGALQAGADGTLRAELPLTAVPEGVRQVIALRRRRLGEMTNRLLDVAATVDGPCTALEQTRQLAARPRGLALGWQLMHHQAAEDALGMAIDEGVAAAPLRLCPGRSQRADRNWGGAAIAGIAARVEARMGHTAEALPLLACPVRAPNLAAAWAPNYTRTAFEVVETLWLLDRRDHLAVDHDKALMHLRVGDATAAAPYVDAAAAAFERLAMTGWARRLARTAGSG
ncbi:hypothetical protein [Pseudonocardia sp.]|uniref:hypothetical protein n=1 Tax=Pseudonocardia sp. TaxID=60912 RepID=UPI003D0E10A3